MLTLGTLLQNRYRIITLLGQGGMGAVYQAQDLRLGQVVALKENLGGDPRQFQQEAVLLANLHHPNLPRVIDHFVEPNGVQYLVMDYVEGEDLETCVARQGALPEAQVLAWFEQILDAIAYMHSRGVIHRDIKPANIKITPTGQAVLVDFGIAKVYQPGRPTVTGAKAATPGFASPEQYRGGTDARSDIYSLGATLYALVTGQVPPDALALAGRSAMLMPPRMLNSALSVQTEQAIVQAMAILPDQRFQNASAMRRALKVVLFAPTVPALQSAPLSLPPAMHVRQSNVMILGVVAAIVVILVLLLFGLGIAGAIWWARVPETPTRGMGLALETRTPTMTLPFVAVSPTATALQTFSPTAVARATQGISTLTPVVTVAGPVRLRTPVLAENGLELAIISFQRPLRVEGIKILPPDQEFILVSVRLQNTRKTGTPIEINRTDFKVKGDGGLVYEANPKTIMVPQMITQTKVPPNVTLDGELIFQIAKDDSGLRLYWNIGSTGRVFLLEP